MRFSLAVSLAAPLVTLVLLLPVTQPQDSHTSEEGISYLTPPGSPVLNSQGTDVSLAPERDRLAGGVWRLGEAGWPIKFGVEFQIPPGQAMLQTELVVYDAQDSTIVYRWFMIRAGGTEIGYTYDHSGLQGNATFYSEDASGPRSIASFGGTPSYSPGDVLVVFLHATAPVQLEAHVSDLPPDSVRLDERKRVLGPDDMDLSGVAAQAPLVNAANLRMSADFYTEGCTYGKVGLVAPGGAISTEEAFTLHMPTDAATDVSWVFGPEYWITGAPSYEWGISYERTGVSEYAREPYVALMEGACPAGNDGTV